MKKQSSFEHIVYGHHAIQEILNDKEKINHVQKIMVDEKKHKQYHALLNQARKHKISVQYVPEIKIEKIARGKNHQGIVAEIIEIKLFQLNDLINQSTSFNLILLLDRITDVRNFGAIARSAYTMGVNAIIIPQKNSADINADAIKTSAGALLKIPICKEPSTVHALELLKDYGFQIIACHEKTSQTIQEINFTKPTVIILGSEYNGISKEHLKLANAEAKIPMIQNFNSLNVSVSAGIILYEIQRQRLSQ